MKNALTAIMITLACLMFSGCAEEKMIDGVVYQPYGLFDQSEHKNPNIAYEVDVPNVVWAIIFCETIVVPVIVVGWDLYEPIRKADPHYVPH